MHVWMHAFNNLHMILHILTNVHFRLRGFSMVKQCGPQLALVIPDARAERTKAHVSVHSCVSEDVRSLSARSLHQTIKAV